MGINLSVIVTVKNDEEGVKRLLADLKKQTVKPDEIIVIRAENYGNCTRGKGRNIGVKMAGNELIAVTDAGCRPRRDWVEKMVARLPRPFGARNDGGVVIAGWYRAVAETPWQKAFLPYLVPTIKKDKKNKKEKRGEGRTFLPASRSIAFTKKAWKLVGGFPEEPVSGGEDLKFADNLYKNPEINIVFEPEALVDWPVPATLEEFIKDMVKHTRGNFEAGYWPHIYRNLSVVVRWAVLLALPLLIPMYLFVAVFNKGPALRGEQGRALRALRMITARVAADAAVVYGTVIGIIDEWVIKKLRLPASGG